MSISSLSALLESHGLGYHGQTNSIYSHLGRIESCLLTICWSKQDGLLKLLLVFLWSANCPSWLFCYVCCCFFLCVVCFYILPLLNGFRRMSFLSPPLYGSGLCYVIIFCFLPSRLSGSVSLFDFQLNLCLFSKINK